MDGLGSSPTPTKSGGAFELPQAPKAASGTDAVAGQSPAKPQTEHLAINVGTGDAKPSDKPVELPKVPMQQPVTVLKASGSNVQGATGKAIITYVVDGDTAYAGNVKCRIDGVDSPEIAHPEHGKPTGEPYGQEAKATLEKMIKNREVTIRISKPTDGRSNYGRDVCQIEIEGKDVTMELLKAGAGQIYSRYGTTPERQAAQSDAQANKRGIWGMGTPPSNSEQFRHMQKYGK